MNDETYLDASEMDSSEINSNEIDLNDLENDDTLTFNEYLEQNKKDSYNDVSLYRIDARIFIGKINSNEIESWDFNRELNHEHIKNICENLNHMIGSLKLVRKIYDENKLFLVDGQHRTKALIQKLEEDPKFNIDIYIDIKDVKSENELLVYFKNINTILPMKTENIPTLKYKNIIDLLYKEFPNAFREDNTVRPYTSKNKLLGLFKSFRVFEDYQINELQLFTVIIDKNKKKSLSDCLEYPPRLYEQLKKTGFYLLADKNDGWIKNIIFDLKSKKFENSIKKMHLKK